MSEELNEDPFAEGEDSDDENLITDGMVKKATYLIHKLANQKNEDFEKIRNKCKKLFGYTNLAKVTVEDGHKIIEKLIELTGGEEQQEQGARVTDDLSPQLPTKPDEGLPKKEVKKEPTDKDHKIEVIDEDLVTSIMRDAIRDAVDITLKEVVEKDVPVQGLGGFVLELGKVIFEAKMSKEVDK